MASLYILHTVAGSAYVHSTQENMLNLKEISSHHPLRTLESIMLPKNFHPVGTSNNSKLSFSATRSTAPDVGMERATDFNPPWRAKKGITWACAAIIAKLSEGVTKNCRPRIIYKVKHIVIPKNNKNYKTQHVVLKSKGYVPYIPIRITIGSCSKARDRGRISDRDNSPSFVNFHDITNISGIGQILHESIIQNSHNAQAKIRLNNENSQSFHCM